MEKIIYRKSNKDDLPQIIDLLTKLGLDKSEPVKIFVVATISPLILGCARIKEMKDGSLELASVAVREEYRGQGIGGKLVEILIKQELRRPIYLMCRKVNRHFYEQLGFKAIESKNLPAPILAEFIPRRNRLAKEGIRGAAMKIDS